MPLLQRITISCLFVLTVLTSGYVLRASEPAYSLIDLGTLPGDMCSEACALNNAGDVVGSSGNERERPFLYRNGTMTQVVDGFGSALDVNDAGQVVGAVCPESGLCVSQVFTYQNGITTFLEGLPGNTSFPYAVAYGINNVGTIVGESKNEGMIIQNGITTGLSRRAARTVTKINDAGLMIGQLESWHAFLFDNNNMKDLGTLDDGTGFEDGSWRHQRERSGGWKRVSFNPREMASIRVPERPVDSEWALSAKQS